jgi:phage terminase Nu1 subunit (DNA packaging protein)
MTGKVFNEWRKHLETRTLSKYQSYDDFVDKEVDDLKEELDKLRGLLQELDDATPGTADYVELWERVTEVI